MAEQTESTHFDESPERGGNTAPRLPRGGLPMSGLPLRSLPLGGRWDFRAWFWFILKNFVGWLLILVSVPIGLTLPGPGGLPLFFIGFALITFPGKRRLTARVLRGRPVRRDSKAFRATIRTIAVVLPGLVLAYLGLFQKDDLQDFLRHVTPRRFFLTTFYIASVLLIWIFGLRMDWVINFLLSFVPRIRRKVRPWMRRKGMDLLPPRRRRRRPEPDDGVLEIHERHQKRARFAWETVKPWLIRLIRIAVIVAIFVWMARPIYKKWPEVGGRILATNWWHFGIAALMFSIFLFVFRATSWRWILIGLGHRLPVAPATRIWSMSELARYVPGVIWQVVGRVYLSKPYGVNGSVSSTSQLLELAIFMLANILVALTCLLSAGFQHIPPGQRQWVFISMALVPVLLLLLHPPIFYGLLNRLLHRLKKPAITSRLPKRALLILLLWAILGLLWQSLAIWLLTKKTLELPLARWWILAGAYCLAWTVGFSVGFLAPGGIGVREVVFITTLQFVLPADWVKAQHFSDPNVLRAFLGFLGILLRLWAIAGELLMAGLAFVSDYRGARGKPGAPGRIAFTAQLSEAE
jgi:hypothetical protein